MPVGVIGAGAIGKTHVDRALRHADVELVGIADAAPQAEELARRVGILGSPTMAKCSRSLGRGES